MLDRRGFSVRLDAGVVVAVPALVLKAGLQRHAGAHAALDRSDPEAGVLGTEVPGELECISTREATA